jgi:hypothetical protein
VTDRDAEELPLGVIEFLTRDCVQRVKDLGRTSTWQDDSR